MSHPDFKSSSHFILLVLRQNLLKSVKRMNNVSQAILDSEFKTPDFILVNISSIFLFDVILGLHDCSLWERYL